ncbi:MAG: Fe-S-oxidoreductase [Planctomycetota bacterium]|jgi:23S rRNA (adenine2503-C2)-methyltransferase
MQIIERIPVPTGDILIVQGARGKLEMLSLGDYGKDVNLKSDALGLTRDLGRVEHTALLPLEKKWVITISTQYGCSMRCQFCDVPKVGAGINATLGDLQKQVLTGLQLHPEVRSSSRLNIHFARMGEPTFNPNVLEAAKWLKQHVDPEYRVHPVVSTMMPRQNQWLRTFIHTWMRIKNRLYHGEAGLQLSINSTSPVERGQMLGDRAYSLPGIAKIMDGIVPVGRKITLNFAVAGYEIEPTVLLEYFDPENYIIKLTPMHKTATAEAKGIRTEGDYCTLHPYQEHEEQLKAAGYEVLVFVASDAEDMSRITCGNAILSGTRPEE